MNSPPAERRRAAGLSFTYTRHGQDSFTFDIQVNGIAMGVAFGMGVGAVSLAAIYFSGVNPERLIRAAIEAAFGARREDRDVGDINSGCLLVELHCHTAKSFLQFLDDYESGKIRDRLNEELLKIDIEMESLTVEIENMIEAKALRDKLRKVILDDVEGERVKNEDVETDKFLEESTRNEKLQSADTFGRPELKAHGTEGLGQGYADERFPEEVDDDLHCAICSNILKNPKQCEKHEHHFCSPCITRHLQNTPQCPICRDPLSEKTLKKPSRYLANTLSQLNIRCEYAHRGCEAVVKLEELDRHEATCQFAPVRCSNQGCAQMSNKHTQNYNAICDDLEAMKKEMDKVKEQLLRQEEIIKRLNDTKFGDSQLTEIERPIKRLVTGSHHFNVRQDIIICGGIFKNVQEQGQDGNYEIKSLCTPFVEKFSWFNRTWAPLKSMKESHLCTSSVVYKHKILVLGGSNTTSIEALRLDQEAASWHHHPAKLPCMTGGHKAIVCQDRLIVVGGRTMTGDDWETLDVIHEVSLTAPYSSRTLAHMPQTREYHGAELFEDKILIIGGAITGRSKDSTDGVMYFHLKENTFQPMPPLPFPVCCFATVAWGDNVILIGGYDKNCEVLNTVVMYNVRSGKSSMLPSMKEKRSGCSAAVTGNVIVVMGGRNTEQEHLNTAEQFSFDSYTWSELPPMTERRHYATAQVV